MKPIFIVHSHRDWDWWFWRLETEINGSEECCTKNQTPVLQQTIIFKYTGQEALKIKNIYISVLISSKESFAHLEEDLLKFYTVGKAFLCSRGYKRSKCGFNTPVYSSCSLSLSNVQSRTNIVQSFCHLIQTQAVSSKAENIVNNCTIETWGKKHNFK